MKKVLLVVFFLGCIGWAQATPPVSDKVLKIFQLAFPAVQNPQWYEYPEYYEVYFSSDDMKTHLRYDLNGTLLRSIRYYDDKNLPPFLKAKVMAEFKGKMIFGVTEMTTESELTYDIIVEDDKEWIRVKTDALGTINVQEKFKKDGHKS